MLQTNLLPLDPSPLSICDRIESTNFREVLKYGTDADCRRALSYVADLLDGEDIETLLQDKEDVESKLDEEETERRKFEEFFDDTVQLVEEYNGRYPCAEPYNIAPIVADTFREHDEMRTTLANIRQAIADGESAEYISSLLD